MLHNFRPAYLDDSSYDAPSHLQACISILLMENIMEVHNFSIFILRFFSILISALIEKKRKWIWRKYPLFSPLSAIKSGVSILPSIRFSAFRIWRIYGDLRYGQQLSHGEVTAQSQLGHSSVTARSQLNHGILSMITAQSRLGHSSIMAQVMAQSWLAVPILVTVSSRWVHCELTVSSHGDQFFSHGSI